MDVTQLSVQLHVSNDRLEEMFRNMQVSEEQQQALTAILAQANGEQAEQIGHAIERGQVRTVEALGATMQAAGMDLSQLGVQGYSTDPAKSVGSGGDRKVPPEVRRNMPIQG